MRGLKVLEILNANPGETFIQEHARAIIENTDIELSWGFWQTGRPGALPKVFPELHHCIGLVNPNRTSIWEKLKLKIWYWNHADAWTHALIEQVKMIKPDIIHFHFASLATRHYRWVKDLGIPFTFSIRGSDIQTETIGSGKAIKDLKIVAERAKAIHAVCDHLKDELFHYCGVNSKTITIRTAISDHWRLVERQPVKGNVLSIGRLHWRKNYSDLLLTLHAVRKRGIDVKLTIIGEGDQRPLLEYMIRDLDMGDVVELAGRQDRQSIRYYLSRADLFVLPSIAEGFPNVVGEAAMARVPIVASADSYVTEVFDPNYEVVIAPTGDPESLSSKIQMVFEMNNEEREKMIAKAQLKAINTFSMRQHSEAFQAFWSSAVR